MKRAELFIGLEAEVTQPFQRVKMRSRVRCELCAGRKAVA